jgi:Flp pilus assembly pilin Flp
MKRLKVLITSLAFMAVSLTPFALTANFALAADNLNPGGYACGGTNANDFASAECNQEGDKLPAILTNIINIFSWIVGVVSVIMIIYGGFRYITSGGDSNGVTAAKNTILYAIIGLVIVALSQVIVQFVLTKSNEAAS